MYRQGTIPIPPEKYIINPGYLKLELMTKGIRVDNGIFEKGLLKRHLVHPGGVVGGVDLYLPEKTWVNVLYEEEFARNSPYRLSEKNGRFYVSNSDRNVEVALIPQPEFYTQKTSTGVPFPRIGVVHGGYIAITPSKGCDFFKNHIECKYCSEPPQEKDEEVPLFTVDEVLETVEAANKEGKAGIVYLSMGSVQSHDGGIEILRPYITAIKKTFNILVAIESLPPKENRWIDETYALGADSVLYNLEIFDPKLFKEICPGREELIGRERYLEALKYAASIFPNGTVASHLIVGLEPPESTIKGIEFLTNIGVVPVLPTFMPVGGTKIEGFTMPSTEEIAPIYGYLYRRIKRNKINMNWVRDISIITTPFEGRFFIGEKVKRYRVLQGFYKTRIGAKTAWGLSTLRRKLRVRDTGEAVGMNDEV